MYRGKTMSLTDLGGGFVEWLFDDQGSPVNSLGTAALKEWEEILAELESYSWVQGVLLTSAKSSFIAGANIKEFPAIFSGSTESVCAWASHVQHLCNRLESLPFATVSAIDGAAFGGGFELVLATDRRVMSHSAKVGLPEVTLGICPGWGGSVRLARMLGVPAVLQWVLEGKPYDARQALDAGVADLVTHSHSLRNTALTSLKALSGRGPSTWEAIRLQKRKPSGLTADISTYLRQFAAAPGKVPAYTILRSVQAHCQLPFEDALALEAQAFASLATGADAQALIGLFISEQRSKSFTKQFTGGGEPVVSCAVVGAGLMGGEIAYQAASSGVSVVLRDIHQAALELGVNTARNLVAKAESKGKLSADAAERTMGRIHPTMAFERFVDASFVIEAVVERFDVKRDVLRQVESNIREGATLTTNTSTLSIDDLAESLERPEQFCGMHFFNPASVMPLVEIVKGTRSSGETIANAVRFALALGKKPIIVQDCPGFLINRILFPYFNAFNRLLLEGVSYERIDRVMESFGWPMGPALLADVIGLDTMVHADKVLQRSYPDRMAQPATVVVEQLLEDGFLGKKSGEGFYCYASGGKTASPNALSLLDAVPKGQDLNDDQIVERLMIPFCAEALRCLDEQIVSSADEVDLGAVLGLGFPRFRGGPLRYIESLGLDTFLAAIQRLSFISTLYSIPTGLTQRIVAKEKIYK